MKRLNDEQDNKWGAKKAANEESRGRLDNHLYRRDSPRDQPRSPGHPRRDSSEKRREEQRRADESYHPSEAAHHPQPTMPVAPYGPPQPSQGPPPQSTPVQTQAPPPQRTPVPVEHQQTQPPQRMPMMGTEAPPPQSTPREERKPEIYEPAARKMEIDDDYDDAGPDEKKGEDMKSELNGTNGATKVES